MEEPVSLVDLLGTVLSLLDVPVPARVRSRNLVQLLAGQKKRSEAFATLHGKGMLVSGGHKLICDTEADICRLYDLQADHVAVIRTDRGCLHHLAVHQHLERLPVWGEFLGL